MMIGLEYWTYIGLFNLVIMTYQDFKKGMYIDDRHNFLMFGVSLSLASHISVSMWYLLSLIGITIMLRWFLKRFKAVGEGDINALAWIFYGLGILNIYYLAYFVAFFVAISVFYYLLKLYIFKYKENTPFMIVVLVSFVIHAIIFGLF